MDIKVLQSAFVYSVPNLSLMRHHSKEIAFIGRSNAGKSSLINAICQKKDLARTSKTPGRTRHAVVYDLVLSSDDQAKSLTLVDLPGFGFASMSKVEAQACEALIFTYLKKRQKIDVIVLLLDIRRAPDEREKEIVEIAEGRGIDVVVVLTKGDKIPLAKRKPVITDIADELSIDKNAIYVHSTHSEKYARELREMLFKKSL